MSLKHLRKCLLMTDSRGTHEVSIEEYDSILKLLQRVDYPYVINRHEDTTELVIGGNQMKTQELFTKSGTYSKLAGGLIAKYKDHKLDCVYIAIDGDIFYFEDEKELADVLRKNVPMKITYNEDKEYYCQKELCGSGLEEDQPYCLGCGQMIDWCEVVE